MVGRALETTQIPSVYVETTVISYLCAQPSRDVVTAGHQQTMREWWAQRDRFDLRTSQLVHDEAGAGDTSAADALHIAIAVTSGCEYLVTWNYRHMANAVLRSRIEGFCRERGYEPTIICTPEELVQEED